MITVLTTRDEPDVIRTVDAEIDRDAREIHLHDIACDETSTHRTTLAYTADAAEAVALIMLAAVALLRESVDGQEALF